MRSFTFSEDWRLRTGSRSRRDVRRRHGFVLAAVTAALATSGCSLISARPAPAPLPPPPAGTAASSAPVPTPTVTATALPTPTLIAPPSSIPTPSALPTTATTSRTDLSTAFAQFTAGQSGTISVAYTAVGGSGTPVVLGDLGSPVAWSTSKVPIAIAVERTSRASGLRPSMRSAITASDNDAAETLWQSLGTPDRAATATNAVLRDFGDPSTQTQSQRVRPPYTAFGQTTWSLADQARFGASLPCRVEAQPVYAAMGQIISSQKWGLGTIPDAHFKGGWGPSTSGYLVRQFGVIDTPNGQVAVAIAVEAASFEQGTTTLSRTARWVQSQANELPAGRC